MSQAPESQPSPIPRSHTPIEPRVARRTLGIMFAFFGGGILLALIWVSREIKRVRQIEHVAPPAAQSAPQQTAPANTPR